MADGTTKAISDVRPGDKVKTTDPVSGSTQDETVEQHHVNQDTMLTDLVTVADGHRSTVHTTQNHLFYDDTRHAWVNAADLKPGDHLRTVAGTAVVVGVHNATNSRDMHDLTVANIHTYYVVAGAAMVLVHNCGLGLDDLAAAGKASDKNGLTRAGFEQQKHANRCGLKGPERN